MKFKLDSTIKTHSHAFTLGMTHVIGQKRSLLYCLITSYGTFGKRFSSFIWGMEEDYSFSSEIFGRRRLHDRVPVLLLKLPRTIDGHQRRGSYRVAVTLKALAEWEETARPGVTLSKPAVVTNLSGGGAQVFVRQIPASKSLRLTLSAPEEYVEQAVRRRTAKRGRFTRPSMAGTNLSNGAERDIRYGLEALEARIVNCRLQTTDGRGPVYALAVSFNEPQESCYNLVRFLERDTIGKGLETSECPLANAA